MILEGVLGLESILVILLILCEVVVIIVVVGVARLLRNLARNLQVLVHFGALSHFHGGRQEVGQVVGQQSAAQASLGRNVVLQIDDVRARYRKHQHPVYEGGLERRDALGDVGLDFAGGRGAGSGMSGVGEAAKEEVL